MISNPLSLRDAGAQRFLRKGYSPYSVHHYHLKDKPAHHEIIHMNGCSLLGLVEEGKHLTSTLGKTNGPFHIVLHLRVICFSLIRSFHFLIEQWIALIT